ncbi:hypothetical protein [Sphingobacterium chuzhouense]|uniref:Uncharacterized protein n=1 Tax=Sphingobacterium chuzhouense TaxID=1742264 RepID=A0ABR7XT50_9SPHI|nr:hypothetical protein [Sphingobacterium chuzhouense]MBD1422348.1 hypothetical protein [Sphingobacterium chuzhouense]
MTTAFYPNFSNNPLITNQRSEALSLGALRPTTVGSKMYFRIRKHLAVHTAGDLAAELARSGTFQKDVSKCQEKSLRKPMSC